MTSSAIVGSLFPDFLDDPDAIVREQIAEATGPFPDTTRIDPLERLFNPAFPARTWECEQSRVGELPGKLHAKQLEQLVDPATHRWLFWGNQAGKTTFGAVDCALVALGRHPLQKPGAITLASPARTPPIIRMPPVNAWASALTWELWQNILLPELLSWIPKWRIRRAPQPFKMSVNRDIEVIADNGRISRITGKAAEQGAGRYQSARVDLVWLDEEHPEDVWDEMQPRLLRYGGRTVGTMTPLLGLTYVHGRVYEPVRMGQVPRSRHFYSHAGVADNPAITTEAIAELKAELAHNPAQLEARLHGHFTRPEGAVLPWDPEQMQFSMPDPGATLWTSEHQARLDGWRQRGKWFGSVDHGKWRFAFQFGVADHEGVFRLLDEYFSQNQDADTRAKGIDAQLRLWKAPETIMIAADCADEDLATGEHMTQEINAALERIKSPYRLYPIQATQKRVTIGLTRLESQLNRGAFLVRREMGMHMKWHLGMSASKPGKQVMGSRWKYEISNYRYPTMPDGKVQKDAPDKASADGADMMDGGRYIVMEILGPVVEPRPKGAPSTLQRIQQELAALDKPATPKKDYGHVLRQ